MAGSWSFQSDEAEENWGSSEFEIITIHDLCSPFPRKHIRKTYELSLYLPDLNEWEFLVLLSSLWTAPIGTNGSCLSNLIFTPVCPLHVCLILRCTQIPRQQKDTTAVMVQIDILKGNASFLFHPRGCANTEAGTERVHCYAVSAFTRWLERKGRFVTSYFPCPLLSVFLPCPRAPSLYCSFLKPKGSKLKRWR